MADNIVKPAVYILASKRNGTLYIGETRNLPARISQHKQNQIQCFTQKYSVHLLVWYQFFDSLTDAIATEKRIKKWNRAWKIQLIEKDNPYWNDLSDEIL